MGHHVFTSCQVFFARHLQSLPILAALTTPTAPKHAAKYGNNSLYDRKPAKADFVVENLLGTVIARAANAVPTDSKVALATKEELRIETLVASIAVDIAKYLAR